MCYAEQNFHGDEPEIEYEINELKVQRELHMEDESNMPEDCRIFGNPVII